MEEHIWIFFQLLLLCCSAIVDNFKSLYFLSSALLRKQCFNICSKLLKLLRDLRNIVIWFLFGDEWDYGIIIPLKELKVSGF